MYQPTFFSLGVVMTFLAASCGKESQPDSSSEAPAPVAAAATQSKPAECAPGYLCFRDTAQMRDLDYDPGLVVDADWILFASALDSVEVEAGVGDSLRHDAYIGAHAGGRVVQERNAAGNTAAWVRFRLRRAGAVRVHVSLNEIHGDTIPYVLRLKQSGLAPI